MGSTSPPFAILLPMISAPASPKPNANSIPIFMIAFSIFTVSLAFEVSFVSFNSTAVLGFFAILFTVSIILSIGRRARSLASFENIIEPNDSTMQTNIVRVKPRTALIWLICLVFTIPNTSIVIDVLMILIYIYI